MRKRRLLRRADGGEVLRKSGELLLNEEQYNHFYACMTNPKPLSATLKAGIKKMQELSIPCIHDMRKRRNLQVAGPVSRLTSGDLKPGDGE